MHLPRYHLAILDSYQIMPVLIWYSTWFGRSNISNAIRICLSMPTTTMAGLEDDDFSLVYTVAFKSLFPCPRSRLRIWSRETGSAISSRGKLFIVIRRLNLVLTYGFPPDFGSQVYRATQLRTDRVHCQESTCTGSVNLKIFPVTSAASALPWTK